MCGDSTCWGQTPGITCHFPGRGGGHLFPAWDPLGDAERGWGVPRRGGLWQRGWDLHIPGGAAHTHTRCSWATEQSPNGKHRAEVQCPSSVVLNRQQPGQRGNKIPNQERVNKEVLISQKSIYTSFKKGQGEPKSKNCKE